MTPIVLLTLIAAGLFVALVASLFHIDDLKLRIEMIERRHNSVLPSDVPVGGRKGGPAGR